MRRVRTRGAAANGAALRAGASCVYFVMRREWPAPCDVRQTMSQKSVESVIGRLATDENLRARFIADPAGTLRSLRECGLDLNPAETEALLEMPAESWAVIASGVHPRLQKIALKRDCHEP
jgi:hypothetical protein